METQAPLAAENEDIAAFQPEGGSAALAGCSANPKQAIVAERDRDDGRRELCFIAILVRKVVNGEWEVPQ